MFSSFDWAEFDMYVIDMFHILWFFTCIWIAWNENKMEWNVPYTPDTVSPFLRFL
jgi:hypothetical protein